MAKQYQLFDLPKEDGRVLSFAPLRYPIWTKNKAKLIERYLYYFVMITKHGAYIDGFAGPQNASKTEAWAAKLVLETEPRWLRNFFFCDKNERQFRRLEALKASQPARQRGEPIRTIDISHADFNQAVDEIPDSDQLGPNTATFCLLDQRTFQCHWRTVEVLARHKPEQMKVELFYFLPTGWFDRTFHALRDKSVIERWWGKSDWASLGGMSGHERAELMCARFRDELGYQYAFALPIYGERLGGRVMYHMIHATDHPVAPNLMVRAYRQAVKRKEPLEQLELELDQWQTSERDE